MSKLTPMQTCAMALLKKEKKINPGQLVNAWHEEKTGRLPPAASRDRFGLTAAAYRTLRKLTEKGLLDMDRSQYYFTLK